MDKKMNCYIFIYDPATVANVPAQQISEYIKQNKAVERWWSFVPNTFVFLSRNSLPDLMEKFDAFFEPKNGAIIIAPIDPVALNGFLPEDAWKGFKADIEGPFKATAGEE